MTDVGVARRLLFAIFLSASLFPLTARATDTLSTHSNKEEISHDSSGHTTYSSDGNEPAFNGRVFFGLIYFIEGVPKPQQIEIEVDLMEHAEYWPTPSEQFLVVPMWLIHDLISEAYTTVKAGIPQRDIKVCSVFGFTDVCEYSSQQKTEYVLYTKVPNHNQLFNLTKNFNRFRYALYRTKREIERKDLPLVKAIELVKSFFKADH